MLRKLLKTLPTLGLVFGALGGSAHATPEWPSRSVKLIVPWGAGGASDVTARIVAEKLTQLWGQSVVVDNRPGAHTIIGATAAAKSAPDGYTLFQAVNSTLTVNPFASTKLPYNAQTDFAPIGMMVNVPVLYVASQKSGVQTFEDLVTKAKNSAEGMTLGAGGQVYGRLIAERLLRDTKAPLRFIPYAGGMDVPKALMSGDIDIAFDAPTSFYFSMFSQGKIKPLAVNGKTRLTSLPNVPTLTELGYKNAEAPMWHAIVAPAGVPESIKNKISRDLRSVLEMPDVIEKFNNLSIEPSWKSPEDLQQTIAAESRVMKPLISELGLSLN